MKLGTLVYDSDHTDLVPSLGVVVHETGRLAHDVYIDALDETVADYNPEYPDDDPVVDVQFMSSFMAWTNLTYSYPVSRLVAVEEIHDFTESFYPHGLNEVAIRRLESFVRRVNSAYGTYDDLRTLGA